MLGKSNVSEKFSRPSSIATIGGNYLFCKCEQDDKGLYFFHINHGGILNLIGKVYTRESLLFIKSGGENFFFGVGVCESKIYFYDIDLNELGSYAFSPNSKITAIKYDKKFQKFLVAVSVGDSSSNINICSINSELSVDIEAVYKISSGNIAGLLFIDLFTLIISDCATNEIYFYDISRAKRNIIANFGRDGNGYVRAPGALAQFKNQFVVIDRDNYLVQFFSMQGVFKEQIGGKGISINSFDLPLDVVIEENLMIIADMNNDRLLIFKYSNEGWNGYLGFERGFSAGTLSRPVSVRCILNNIYIADRSNGRVQVFDEDLAYVGHFPTNSNLLYKQPTSLCYLEIKSKSCLAILSRNSNSGSPAISIIDTQTGDEIICKELPELSDPQGMVESGAGTLCVMDTLNRRAVLYDENCNLIKQCNLAKFAQFDRFLCRVPSVIGEELYFCDYHNGIVVVLNKELKYLRTFEIDMSRLKMSNIRKIEKIGKNYLVIGRGEEELAIISDDLMVGDVSFFDKSTFFSVADVCFSSKGDAYFLLKERDTILKYSMSELLVLAK